VDGNGSNAMKKLTKRQELLNKALVAVEKAKITQRSKDWIEASLHYEKLSDVVNYDYCKKMANMFWELNRK
jgi:negative regulator of genetic competence, sporulation and motility